MKLEKFKEASQLRAKIIALEVQPNDPAMPAITETLTTGSGKRRAKRHSRKTNKCPMCDDPTCKLTINDFLKRIK